MENEIKKLLEDLTGLKMAETEIPPFQILNWPRGAGIKIELGKRKFMLPEYAEEANLLTLRQFKGKLIFEITGSGMVIIRISKWYKSRWRIYASFNYYGDGRDNNSRICLLILIHQFQKEIFPQIVSRLKSRLGEHNQIVESAKKALEPFIPAIVADNLFE